jgi:hypothetical protein
MRQVGKSELTLNLITGRVLKQRDSWCGICRVRAQVAQG